MRDAFFDIVSGWTLVSGIGPLTERIEEAARWTEKNGPLQPDEEATIKLMIEAQIARGGIFGDEDILDHPFSNCNVCGKRLREPEEFEWGMCERCADE